MTENYRSVFDIIGPIMIGPSSSHTAGAVAIGRVARQVLGQTPVRVTVHYYESFAQTHQGHGTDYAIVAGLLQMDPADPRVPNSRELASQAGIEINFVEEPGASPIGHPNWSWKGWRFNRLAPCQLSSSRPQSPIKPSKSRGAC